MPSKDSNIPSGKDWKKSLASVLADRNFKEICLEGLVTSDACG